MNSHPNLTNGGAGHHSSSNTIETLKSNMMTMLMFNNMAGSSNGGSGGRSDKNMFTMIYVFLATSVVDFIFKNAPLVLNFFMKKYNDKLETIKKDLASTTKDLTDNKIKKKTASITVTINVNSPDNILGQSLLDYITNNKNTTHVSYIRENFILNQKDVINLEDEVFARMTQSTSTDQGGLGSTSTNNGSGAGGSGGQSSIVQVIEIYSFTKTTDELRAFLENIKQKYTINVKNKLGNKRYFFNMHPLQVPMDIDKRKDLSRLPPNFAFIMKHFQTNRKFSNLFGEDIDTIRNRVNFFIKNRKWYDEKGIPYTLGLLLSGSPGTGKTSTIKCLANETNRHICNVNLNNDMTKTQLENLFFNENINILNPSTGQNETYCIPLDQRIYVLEDVDCQSDIVMERALKNEKNEKNKKNGQNEQDPKGDGSVDRKVLEHYEDKHKVDLSFLLNLLDGVLENPGRIVIMTSNFPDMLDTALIRPGRIDVIAKFRNCSNKTVVDMLEFFYDIKLSEEERERVFQFKEEMVTPAELSKVMFENFSDYEASIRHMENLSIELEKKQKELAEKESKEPLQLGISEQPFSIGATMDMSSYPPTPIYTPLPGDMIPAGEPNTEVGFSEKKGDVIDDDKYQDKYTAIRRRIEEDTTYVFINNIAEQYVSSDKKNRKWEDFMYYSNLLQTRVFNLKEYVDFANECASQCKGVVECVDNLRAQKESLNIEGKLRHNILVYESKLNQFFNPTRMMTTGLKQQMIRDRMTSLMDDGPVLGSQLSALSNQFGDANPLNTSSYSAF